MNDRLMTLAQLRHIGRARSIHRATAIQQSDGAFNIVLDIGPESVVLARARQPDRPRPFQTLAGVITTLHTLDVWRFNVETH